LLLVAEISDACETALTVAQKFYDHKFNFANHRFTAIGKSGTVLGLAVVGVCLPPVSSVTPKV
jgi:hypothetical protein